MYYNFDYVCNNHVMILFMSVLGLDQVWFYTTCMASCVCPVVWDVTQRREEKYDV